MEPGRQRAEAWLADLTRAQREADRKAQQPTIRISTCRQDGRCPECGNSSARKIGLCGCTVCCLECYEAHVGALLTEALRQRDDYRVRYKALVASGRQCDREWADRAQEREAALREERDAAIRRAEEANHEAELLAAHAQADIDEKIRLGQERDAAIRERDLARAHDAQPYPTAEAYERVCAALKEAKAEALKWRRIRTPTHGSCCTCQGCGLDHESCRCDLDEACDRADRSEALLRRCRDTLREVRQTYGPEPGSRVIGLSAILSELDEALS